LKVRICSLHKLHSHNVGPAGPGSPLARALSKFEPPLQATCVMNSISDAS